MANFHPKRADGRAEWRVIFDALADAKPDDQFSYAFLGNILETKNRQAIQQAVRRANHALWKQRNRSLINIPKFGYRMLRANEHEDQATGYQRRSRRQLGSAVMVMTATNLSELDDRERTRALTVVGVLVRMAQAVDDHSRRLAHHDELIQSLENRINRLEQVDATTGKE